MPLHRESGLRGLAMPLSMQWQRDSNTQDTVLRAKLVANNMTMSKQILTKQKQCGHICVIYRSIQLLRATMADLKLLAVHATVTNVSMHRLTQ